MMVHAKRIAVFLILFATAVGLLYNTEKVHTETPVEKIQSHTFPKLANYYLKTPITRSEISELAKWDLLILSPQAQDNSHGAIRRIRRANPDIVILVYVPSQEFPLTYYKDWEKRSPGVWHDLHAGITDDMWLRDSSGQPVTFWERNWMLNIAANATSTQQWNEYLSDYVANELLSSGLWDGVFYDNVFNDIFWINNGDIDADSDGIKDDPTLLGRNWRLGMINLFEMTRAKAGKDIIIVGNGDRGYYGSLNGHYFENFSDLSYMTWKGKTDLYRTSVTASRKPNFSIIGNNTRNTSEHWDKRNVRFGLVTALMFDGYYGFDFGDQGHAQLWWYPEYDVELGEPRGAAYTVTVDGGQEVWRRDFEQGSVLLNPHESSVHVTTNGTYRVAFSEIGEEHEIPSVLTIAAQDAIILTK